MIYTKDLLRLTRCYLLANPVGKKHHANMGQRIARFVSWSDANHVAELTPETVNRFLASLDGLSPHTVNGYRANIMAVWSDAIGTRVIWKIRRAKTPRIPVEGWTVAEIAQLCEAAERLREPLINGISKRLLMLSAIHAGFSTGQRFGDLVALETARIAADGYCEILQSKTGKIVPVRFSRDAMELFAEHKRDFIIPLPYTQKWFCDHFGRLVAAAGITPGTFKFLRRSAGSCVEAATGRGHELLGNTRQVFEQSYRVAKIVQRVPLEPPGIKAV